MCLALCLKQLNMGLGEGLNIQSFLLDPSIHFVRLGFCTVSKLHLGLSQPVFYGLLAYHVHASI
jgi:hypothetical protein